MYALLDNPTVIQVGVTVNSSHQIKSLGFTAPGVPSESYVIRNRLNPTNPRM